MLQNIKSVIALIELKYDRKDRNTPQKMSSLIYEEFNIFIEEGDIIKEVGIEEDYEKENRKIQYGYEITD